MLKNIATTVSELLNTRLLKKLGLCVICALCLSVRVQMCDASKLPVIIFAGQSNLVGRDSARNLTLRHQARPNKDILYAMREVSYQTDRVAQDLPLGPLRVNPDGTYPPAKSFLEVFGGELYGLSFGSGGAGMPRWAPESQGGNLLDQQMLPWIDKQISQIERSGNQVHIVGLVWIQGEGGVYPWYQDRFELFESAMREHFGQDLPILMSSLHDDLTPWRWPNGDDFSRHNWHRSQINEMMARKAETDRNFALGPDITHLEVMDGIHYTADDTAALGRLLADSWIREYGDRLPVNVNEAFVPEPSALMLLVCGMVCLWRNRK